MAVGPSARALGPRGVVLALGTAQTLAWASSYYLPAIVAVPAAADFGATPAQAFALFSMALLIAGIVGPKVGRHIDHLGGRGLLMLSNGVFAAGLCGMALSTHSLAMCASAALMGLGMGMGLYDSAFATLVRLYAQTASPAQGQQQGHNSGQELTRRAITGITLLAGFASTVGYPLTAWMMQQFGWRGACWGWAALHLLVALPLNAWLPRPVAHGTPLAATLHTPPPPSSSIPESAPPQPTSHADVWRILLLLGLFFGLMRFVVTGMGAHLPGLLQHMGASLAVAVGMAAFLGPAQVAGRVVEFFGLRNQSPLRVARWATVAPLVAALLMLWLGLPAGVPFVVLHGLGVGIITIAKGTLPLMLLGPAGYGARQGWLNLPASWTTAAAPWVYGLMLTHTANPPQWMLGANAVIVALALVCVWLLREPPPTSANSADAPNTHRKEPQP